MTSNAHLSIHRVAIFASGAGSNAEKLIEHFQGHPSIKITVIFTNNPFAGVISVAEKHKITVEIVSKADLFNGSVLQKLEEKEINFIVLVGFLLLVPKSLVAAYPKRIINIHPALLPKFGGKGMYGSRVHQSVIDAGETESGITIHYVDEEYDRGDVIEQIKIRVQPGMSASELEALVRQLEHLHLPRVVEKVVMEQSQQLL